jgi:hypothetical protein
MKKYFYPEFLKLAAYAALREKNYCNELAYPTITDVYVEYEGDLRAYNPNTKEGSMFFLIETPEITRCVGNLTYQIVDNVIHYGLHYNYNYNFQTPLTPELVKELKAVEMKPQYFWNLGDNHYKNVGSMTVKELRKALCDILDAGTDCKIEVNSEGFDIFTNSEFYKQGQLLTNN